MNKSVKCITVILALISSCVATAANTISLNNDTVAVNQLGELQVHGNLTRHQGQNDVYIITDDIRRGKQTAGELLREINGITYDPRDQSVSYLGSQNLVILVDSILKNEEFIKSMNPGKFSRITVVNNPGGKYLGYDALINFVTSPVYQGIDTYESAIVHISPNNRNGEGHDLKWNNDRVNFCYTRDKLNIEMDVNYSWYTQGMTFYEDIQFPLNGVAQTMQNRKDSNPSNIQYENRLTGGLGLDYTINPNHSVSLLWRIVPSTTRNTNSYSYLLEKASEPTKLVDYASSRILKNNLRNTFGAYYRGKLSQWQIDADITYTVQNWDDNRFVSRSDGYRLSNLRHFRQDYFWGGVSANREFCDGRWCLSLSSYVMSADITDYLQHTNTKLSKNFITDNTTVATLQFQPLNNFSMSATIGSYVYHNNAGPVTTNAIKPRLATNLFWRPNKDILLRASYSMTPSLPSAGTTVDYGNYQDSLIYLAGNPALAPNVFHQVGFNANLWRVFTVYAGFNMNTNAIVPISEARPTPDGTPYVFQQYQNISTKNWSFGLNINKKWNNGLEIYSNISLVNMEARYRELHRQKLSPSGMATLYYFNQKLSGLAFIQYILVSAATVSPQRIGYGYYDTVSIGIDKLLFNNKLTLSLYYNAPLHIANGETHSDFFSPAYNSVSYGNNQFRSDNFLVIKAQFRFNSGFKVRKYNRSVYDL